MGNKNLWVTLSATFIISAMMVGVTIYSLDRYETLVMKINAIHNRSMTVAQIKNDMLEIEASTRAYLLTNRNLFHDDLEKTRQHLEGEQKKLREPAALDGSLQELMSALERAITLHQANLEATLALAARGNVVPTTGETIVQNVPHQPMAQFKEVIDALEHYHAGQLSGLIVSRDKALLWARIATVVLGAVILSLITALIYLIDRELNLQKFYQENLSQEVARLSVQLLERAEELDALSTHLQNSSEQEKAQLARDLHDEFGGLLTMLKIDLAWIEGRAEMVDPALAQRTFQVNHRVNELIDLKRRVVENLRPSLLDHLGIEAALNWYVKDVAERAGLLLTLNIELRAPRPGPEISIALFRIVQEALTNTIKYAQATTLSVQLKNLQEQFQLTLTDNGIGMNQRERNRNAPAHGLLSMRHRAVALGGSLRIESEPGQGTTIIATIPVAREKNAAPSMDAPRNL